MGSHIDAEDTTSPYSVVWNTTTAPNGSHAVVAVVRDAAGNVRTSPAVPVVVNNSPGSVQIAVDGNQRRQVISGFMVNANSAPWNSGELIPALDMLVDQGAGLYRVIIDKQDWESTNDNSDPTEFNWAYYDTIYTSQKFENLWSTISHLNARGITDGIVLNFMGPGPAWMGAPRITPGLEDEWVESIASLVYYAKVTRQLQFTQLGPANEVDWDGIEGPQIDQWQYTLMLRKLAQRLDALGLTDIRLVGPDTASVAAGVNDYLPELLSDSTAMAKIQHFGFHNYGDSSAGADAVIKGSAYPTRDFWMTEASFGNDYYGPKRLMAQMRNGAASAGVWDAYRSDYNHRPDDSVPMIEFNSGIWEPTQAFYAYKLLFKFAQPGATRLAASASGNLDAVSFYDTVAGRVTVFGHSASGGTVRISFAGVPVMSSLQLYLTSHSRQFERQADVTLVNGVATIAVDGDGYFTLTGSTVLVSDTSPPTVTMTAPAAGSTVVGNVTVSASASDDVAVAGVQFKLDGANLGAEITSGAYSITWNTLSASNGQHILTAIARDTSGKTTTAATVSVTVDNFVDTTPPTVSVTTPINGATVSGTAVAVAASATDNVGVAGVQFKLDGANLGAEITSAPFTITWNSTTTTNGPHTLTAVARDTAGNTTTAAVVSVTVANMDTTPPTVSITTPVNGATVSGTAVAVVASAADNVGVAGVQFLLDGASLGAEVTSAPYTIVWNSTTASLGAHTLTARARDAAGLQTTSSAISVTVTASVPGVVAIGTVATGDEPSKLTTITSSLFSTTSGNQLLLAFVAIDDVTPGNALTGVSGAGLTWSLVLRTNVQRGGTEIWRAFAPVALTNVAVTATIAQSTVSSIVVVSFTGVDTSGTNGSGAIGATRSANAASGAPSGTLTTTRANSWVFGVGNDWDGSTARTVGTGQTLVHQYMPWVGATFWVQRRNGPTPVAGTSVTINDTAPTNHRYNLSIVEILPRP